MYSFGVRTSNSKGRMRSKNKKFFGKLLRKKIGWNTINICAHRINRHLIVGTRIERTYDSNYI